MEGMPNDRSTSAILQDETVRFDPDIVFARRETGDLSLNLYRPMTDRPVPIILWLHGGGWFTGDRTLAPDLVHHVEATGCAVASIEYRLSGQALFPAQLHDVRTAIQFLRARAEQFGMNPTKVGVWGSSAGGHLAALAGLTGHLDHLPGEEETGDASVQAVAESYGPADLIATADTTSTPPLSGSDASTPEARLIGGHPAEHPEAARYASPLTWVTAGAPPFQISHGTGDDLVPSRHSERLHEALTTSGVDSELYLLEGYKHGFLNPPGRLDVDLTSVMDDGRLAAEVAAPARYRSSDCSDAPNAPDEHTTFGFADIEAFFRRHLTPRSTTGDSQ